MNNTGIADFLDQNSVDTDFIDSLPTFDFTLADVVTTFIENQNDLAILTAKVAVLESFEKPKGKFADTYGNLVILDSKYFISLIIEMIRGTTTRLIDLSTPGDLPQAVRDFVTPNLEDTLGLSDLENITINEFAIMANGVLKDREKYYQDSTTQNKWHINKSLRDLTARTLYDVNITSTTPVLSALEGFQFVGIFVQSIFANIVFILSLLSIMLIYSLMVADVDSKTYEMGMLRALGLKWMSICYINSFQSFLFSLPGILFGLLISGFLNVIVVYVIYTYSYA